MSPLPPVPARRWLYFALRIVFIVGIVAALIQLNAPLLFRTLNYETGDWAANSLSVLRAEHGQELYGNYSRWHFHHPGPAMFYGEALAELVLYRYLHIVPTPFNAQLLFTLLLMASFFAAGISVAARWMRSGVFIILALGIAALHFVGANASRLFLSNWPPHLIGMVLFALVVAAASVAAGQGDDLPLLTLAGAFLLHMHVAQPLFVVPLFTLAYLGLAWSCWRRTVPALAPITTGKEGDDPPPTTPPVRQASALPWRVYRRAHRWAFCIAAVFALPLLFDLLLYGTHSNFALILAHVREHKGETHAFLDSLDYFLRFAMYQPSKPGEAGGITTFASPHGVLALLGRHAPMTILWLAALGSPLLTVAVRLWHGKETPLLGDAPSTHPLAYASPVGRWRFLGALFLFWALAVGLTLIWGHIQDGEMYFFNAWFNYLIWYVLAMFGAGSLTDALDAFVSRSEHPLLWRGSVVALCIGLAGFVVRRHLDRYQIGDDPNALALVQTVDAILDNEPAGTPRGKLVVFPRDAWPVVDAIALELLRRDRDVNVFPFWAFMLGQDHVFKARENYVSKPVEVNTPYEVWHVVPTHLVPPDLAAEHPVLGYTLVPGGLPVDPSQEFRITCDGQEANSPGYLISGWSPPDTDGFIGTEDRSSWVQFRPHPVPNEKDVEVLTGLVLNLVPGQRTTQRVQAFFNGLNLGEVDVATENPVPVNFVIPGKIWNKYPSAMLVLQFPDAVAPKDVSGGTDGRLFAFKTRLLAFATVPATTPDSRLTPQTPESAPATTSTPAPEETSTAHPSLEAVPPFPTPPSVAPAPTPDPTLLPEQRDATPTPEPEPSP